MKEIGLLGGTSWPSTISYYRILNELANNHSGGYHSANIILRSIDYHQIKSRYSSSFNEVASLLQPEIETLLSYQPHCMLICNNTLHETFDTIRNQLEIHIPVFHMVELTAEALRESETKNILLLGTKRTMEHHYFSNTLKKYDIHVTTPNEQDRDTIQSIQTKLSTGANPTLFESNLASLLDRYATSDGVVLACTELPLVVTSSITSIPIFDPMRIQCEKAFSFSIS